MALLSKNAIDCEVRYCVRNAVRIRTRPRRRSRRVAYRVNSLIMMLLEEDGSHARNYPVYILRRGLCVCRCQFELDNFVLAAHTSIRSCGTMRIWWFKSYNAVDSMLNNTRMKRRFRHNMVKVKGAYRYWDMNSLLVCAIWIVALIPLQWCGTNVRCVVPICLRIACSVYNVLLRACVVSGQCGITCVKRCCLRTTVLRVYFVFCAERSTIKKIGGGHMYKIILPFQLKCACTTCTDIFLRYNIGVFHICCNASMFGNVCPTEIATSRCSFSACVVGIAILDLWGIGVYRTFEWCYFFFEMQRLVACGLNPKQLKANTNLRNEQHCGTRSRLRNDVGSVCCVVPGASRRAMAIAVRKTPRTACEPHAVLLATGLSFCRHFFGSKDIPGMYHSSGRA